MAKIPASDRCLMIFFILLMDFKFANNKVVNYFNPECSQYFYLSQKPNFARCPGCRMICQKFNNQFYYATLYDQNNKIPRYSAYTLGEFNSTGRRPSVWFIEPQLSGMTGEAMDRPGRQIDQYRQTQAVENDYERDNDDEQRFDKGHLNPAFYHSDDTTRNAKRATFTLTNSAPMDPCFNRLFWFQMEKSIKRLMQDFCSFNGAKRYFITGTLPGTQTLSVNAVNIPKKIWTAACCDSSSAGKNRGLGWSLGYIGENGVGDMIQVKTIRELNHDLSLELVTQVTLFASISGKIEHCVHNKTKSKEMTDNLNRKVIPLSLSLLEKNRLVSKVQKRKISGMISAYSDDESSSQSALKRTHLTMSIDFDLNYPKQSRINDVLKPYSLQCLSSTIETEWYTQGKRDTGSLNCTIVNRYDIAISGNFCKLDSKCKLSTNQKYMCTTMTGSQEECCKTPCVGKDKEVPSCSVSDRNDKKQCTPNVINMFTYTGQLCRNGHHCGLHGYQYYWCYTDENKNWNYCCAPWNKCESGRTCFLGYAHGYNNRYCTEKPLTHDELRRAIIKRRVTP